jgi:serine/threonine-protein kinase
MPILCQLSHQNIVSIYDLAKRNEDYIVMEYVKGPDFKDIIRNQAPIPPEKAILCSPDRRSSRPCPCQPYHPTDIKPQNISLRGWKGQVRFWIAKLPSAAPFNPYGILSFVLYLSPELAKGAQTTQHTTSFNRYYSYEMITGKCL